MKIKISDQAREKLKEILSEEESRKPLRLYIAGYGWGGPSFGMALDEPKEKDLKIQSGGFDFLVEEKLKELYKSFSVDYSDTWLRKGFIIAPDMK